MVQVSAVPGGTVERMTIVWVPGLWRSARPMLATTFCTASMDTRPSGALGVPTETNDTSVPATAAATSIVAVSLPLCTIHLVLDDGRLPGVDEGDLLGGNVHRDHLVTEGRQARAGDGADITHTEYRNLHLL